MNHHPVQYSCSSRKSNATEEILYPCGPIAIRSQGCNELSTGCNELSTLQYDKNSVVLFVRMMRTN